MTPVAAGPEGVQIGGGRDPAVHVGQRRVDRVRQVVLGADTLHSGQRAAARAGDPRRVQVTAATPQPAEDLGRGRGRRPAGSEPRPVAGRRAGSPVSATNRTRPGPVHACRSAARRSRRRPSAWAPVAAVTAASYAAGSRSATRSQQRLLGAGRDRGGHDPLVPPPSRTTVTAQVADPLEAGDGDHGEAVGQRRGGDRGDARSTTGTPRRPWSAPARSVGRAGPTRRCRRRAPRPRPRRAATSHPRVRRGGGLGLGTATTRSRDRRSGGVTATVLAEPAGVGRAHLSTGRVWRGPVHTTESGGGDRDRDLVDAAVGGDRRCRRCRPGTAPAASTCPARRRTGTARPARSPPRR